MNHLLGKKAGHTQDNHNNLPVDYVLKFFLFLLAVIFLAVANYMIYDFIAKPLIFIYRDSLIKSLIALGIVFSVSNTIFLFLLLAKVNIDFDHLLNPFGHKKTKISSNALTREAEILIDEINNDIRTSNIGAFDVAYWRLLDIIDQMEDLNDKKKYFVETEKIKQRIDAIKRKFS